MTSRMTRRKRDALSYGDCHLKIANLSGLSDKRALQCLMKDFPWLEISLSCVLNSVGLNFVLNLRKETLPKNVQLNVSKSALSESLAEVL